MLWSIRLCVEGDDFERISSHHMPVKEDMPEDLGKLYRLLAFLIWMRILTNSSRRISLDTKFDSISTY